MFSPTAGDSGGAWEEVAGRPALTFKEVNYHRKQPSQSELGGKRACVMCGLAGRRAPEVAELARCLLLSVWNPGGFRGPSLGWGSWKPQQGLLKGRAETPPTPPPAKQDSWGRTSAPTWVVLGLGE